MKTEKPGEVIRGSGDGSPPAGSRGRSSSWWGLGDKAPRNGGLGAEPPEAGQVLMIIKTFLAEILLIKCCIYN